MNKINPLELFEKEAPDVQKAYADLINSLVALKSLDQKTKHLIYIGMKVVTDDFNAVLYHVPMAKKAGATRDEIKETIVLSLSVTGLKSISTFLSHALEIYDNA
ncbi:carboxymuconolactone decarboxylase family protein [uncultured Draconibacterium sp.]|uniref:carboxymuconolactone decarboxylase family protein n=1 Tax=uncultured Draconibacterium sp. TaxID=1573823 RepID=UPI002AA6BEAA|nr:carboxymuconolactone decarboxylase family protein [uncultured Draconibacterium sp.]